MRKTYLPILILLAIAANPTWALTLTGNVTPAPTTAANIPCPEHPGHDCYTTALDAEVLGAGPNSDFISAWNTVIPREWDPALWSLTWSTDTLDATLNITAYDAYNYKPTDPQYDSFYAGAEIRIAWNPTSDQQDMLWIQAIHSNRGRSDLPYYLDISNTSPNRAPQYPYAYADQHFYDKPSRWCEADQHIFWDGFLYLATIDYTGKAVTVYEGIHWGYTIDCTPVPEPCGTPALCTGFGVLCFGARCRRRA